MRFGVRFVVCAFILAAGVVACSSKSSGGGGTSSAAFSQYMDRFVSGYCSWLVSCGKTTDTQSQCVSKIGADPQTATMRACSAAAAFYDLHRSEFEQCLSTAAACGSDDLKAFCPILGTSDWNAIDKQCQSQDAGTSTEGGLLKSTFGYHASADTMTTYTKGDADVAELYASSSSTGIVVVFKKTDGSGWALTTKGLTAQKYSSPDAIVVRYGAGGKTDYISYNSSDVVTLTKVGGVGSLVEGTFEVVLTLAGCQSCSKTTYLGSFSVVRN